MMTYLALGDSYTIGELVEPQESFPFLLAAALNREGLAVADPVVIARTGWTTDELSAAVEENAPAATFSFVTLLIGVNNQYRGRSAEDYSREFTALLHRAIAFAGDVPGRVCVLSIPDWGVTPFAAGKDALQIAREIDAYNRINKDTALSRQCRYVDITDSTRNNASLPGYLVSDGLHPSGREYALWAERLVPVIGSMNLEAFSGK